jgi:hypothetical protein
MSGNQLNPLVATAIEHPELVRSPDPVPPHDARPLDWGHVVDAAAARLEESWVRPDATGYMAASGLAQEFAATLCAYGMVAEEVAHMRGRIDDAADAAAMPQVDGAGPLLGVRADAAVVAK